jgi:hypothetical protein
MQGKAFAERQRPAGIAAMLLLAGAVIAEEGHKANSNMVK